jgi:multidrug efflux pump subunit AcrB
MPVLVAPIATVVVFLPVVFLSGIGKYLFTLLTVSVAFAMFASYVLSRTLAPAYCACVLKGHAPGERPAALFRFFDAGYTRELGAYRWTLTRALGLRMARGGIIWALPLVEPRSDARPGSSYRRGTER